MLAAGTLYWLMWAKVLPALLGYKIEPQKEVLADGSEVIKYVVSASLRKHPIKCMSTAFDIITMLIFC